MILRNKIGILSTAVMTLIVVLITIRLSGHRHSLGVLVLGLFGIYFAAVLVVAVLRSVQAINRRMFFIATAILMAAFVFFFVYHQSYDSHNETRSIFWGLNGETDKN